MTLARESDQLNTAESSSVAVAIIAAMITPALLILASASLVASALVRMARVVDRARILATAVHDGTGDKLGVPASELREWLLSHAARARQAERSIVLLYSAIVVFIATCLAIALNRATGDSLVWLPVLLATTGAILMLGGGAYMVAESRSSGKQIGQEIGYALSKLEDLKS